MLRPAEFTTPHRTSTVTPYQMISDPAEQPERGSSNGGVFHRGQIVWTRGEAAVVSTSHAAIGFVEGLGHVLLDGRFLRPFAAAAPATN